MSFNNKISVSQLQALIILYTLGSGITFLPRQAAEAAAQDGWLGVIAAAILAIIYMFLITTAADRIESDSFAAHCRHMLTTPIGFIVNVLFMAKIIVTSALWVRFFTEIIKQNMLYKTPATVIAAVILLLAAYAAAMGYETRARLAQILMVVIFIPLIFVLGIAVFDVDITNVAPVMVATPKDLALCAYRSSLAFTGIELVLLAFPYLRSKDNAKKACLRSTVFISIFMVIVTVLTIARFGADNLNRQMWPVLQLMYSIHIPGAFIERQDALIMSFWIVAVFAALSAGVFFTAVLSRDIIRSGTHKTHLIIWLPVILLLSFVPESINQAYNWMKLVNNTLGIGFLFFIPLLLVVVSALRKWGDTK